MKKLKLLLLSSTLVFFSACGTEAPIEIDPNRGFDMWEYMTPTLDYAVDYDVYENGQRVNSYNETHRIFRDHYKIESGGELTTLFLSGSDILQRDSIGDVNIERYVRLGDSGVMRSPSTQLCTVQAFFPSYGRYGMLYENVLMFECTSKTGVNQKFYYGFNEGIVALYKQEGNVVTEIVKVNEIRI